MQNWILVFHLFGLVCWIGALIALTRLMAWRIEQPADIASATVVLEKKLLFGGAFLGMGISVVTGFIMLLQQEWGPLIPSVSGGGFHLKLLFVFALIVLTFVFQVQVVQHAAGGHGARASMLNRLYFVVLLLLLGALVSVYVLYPLLKSQVISGELGMSVVYCDWYAATF
jgi:uncharacterized membrane protein